MSDSSILPRRLVAAGIVLFLLGLLTGFVIPAFLNPRMGLASHLEGVMNGTFLIALGVAWHYARLTPGQATLASWLLLYGSYANWLFVTLAAVFGTSGITPIAGEGYGGTKWQEQLISAGLLSVGLAMVAGVGMFVFGLFRKGASNGEPAQEAGDID